MFNNLRLKISQKRANEFVVSREAKHSQAGFTLTEVMVSLLVFIVSVGGIVAMESKGLEVQIASRQLREAEGMAQSLMIEAQTTGFADLVQRDVTGNPGVLPYDDMIGLRDFSAVPMDIDPDEVGTGVQKNFYWVGRRVSQVMLPGSVPAGNDPSLVDALQIEIFVLWLDVSNTVNPPPADLTVADLVPENIIAGDADFSPWVQGVHLRTVRLNDG